MNTESNSRTEEIQLLQSKLDFELPNWYVSLMRQTHEKVFEFEEGKYLRLWPIVETIEINQEYNAENDFPGFFLIETYEIGEACALEKETGSIYTVPFIDDIPDDATYVGEKLDDLLTYLHEPW